MIYNILKNFDNYKNIILISYDKKTNHKLFII